MVLDNSQTNPPNALQAAISKGEMMGTTRITDIVIASGHQLEVKISRKAKLDLWAFFYSCQAS